MCGRLTQVTSADELAEYFGTERAIDLVREVLGKPRYNVAPSQFLAAVRSDEGQRTWASFKWGLVPFWADDPSIGNRMINARSETAPSKPAYKQAFRKRRCLIPADGFYEWKKGDGKKKTPYYIRPEEDRPFGLAGLWEHWSAKDGSTQIDSCTILTSKPNDVVGRLHNRMPVIIPSDAFDVWLHSEDTDEVKALLSPRVSDPMKAFAVSTHVNRPVNDDPSCIEPVEDAGSGSGGARGGTGGSCGDSGNSSAEGDGDPAGKQQELGL